MRRVLSWGSRTAMLSVMLLTFSIDAKAQTTTYSLGTATGMLNAAFYAGEAIDGSNVAGRIVANVGVNHAGTRAVFWAINMATLQMGLFQVDIGDPSSWERLSPDGDLEFDQMSWSPDDSAVFFANSKFVFSNGSIQSNVVLHGYQVHDGTFTAKASDNWFIGAGDIGVPGNNEIVALPVLPNGTEDSGRTPVVVTNFGIVRPVGNRPIGFPYVSLNGDAVAFSVVDTSGTPDIFDSYLLENLPAILAASKIPSTDISSLAPTSLASPDVVDIRASDSSNVVTTTVLSHDGSLVLYSEDYNNAFDLENFFGSVAAGSWDINYALRDGTGDVQLVSPNNQSFLNPFPTGNRLTFVEAIGGPVNFHIFASSLTASSDISVETNPLPDNGTTAVIGGQPVNLPFVLTDSAVQASTDITAVDASGTTVELPADQVINFPDGSGATGITIFTPVDPVAEIELPDPETSIPVIRDFGPDGTVFYPPITITIAYTDGEIANIQDEANMIPYLYNVGLGIFEPLDPAFLSSVVVDTINNTISFQTDHFSMYGIGGAELAAAPQRNWALAATTLALVAMTLIVIGAKSQLRKNG